MLTVDPTVKLKIDGRDLGVFPLSVIADLYSLGVKDLLKVQLAIAKGETIPTLSTQVANLELTVHDTPSPVSK